MLKVKGEEVKRAAMKAGVRKVSHMGCACDEGWSYEVRGGDLFHVVPCDGCVPNRKAGARPVAWDEVAATINAQSDEAAKIELLKAWGFDEKGIVS